MTSIKLKVYHYHYYKCAGDRATLFSNQASGLKKKCFPLFRRVKRLYKRIKSEQNNLRKYT